MAIQSDFPCGVARLLGQRTVGATALVRHVSVSVGIFEKSTPLQQGAIGLQEREGFCHKIT